MRSRQVMEVRRGGEGAHDRSGKAGPGKGMMLEGRKEAKIGVGRTGGERDGGEGRWMEGRVMESSRGRIGFDSLKEKCLSTPLKPTERPHLSELLAPPFPLPQARPQPFLRCQLLQSQPHARATIFRLPSEERAVSYRRTSQVVGKVVCKDCTIGVWGRVGGRVEG